MVILLPEGGRCMAPVAGDMPANGGIHVERRNSFDGFGGRVVADRVRFRRGSHESEEDE